MFGHILKHLKNGSRGQKYSATRRVVKWTLFPAFGFVVRHGLSQLIYYYKFKEFFSVFLPPSFQ